MPQLPETIFLTGYAGVGKDFIAQVLVEQAGFTRLAFADALKQEVADQEGITIAELERKKGFYRQQLQTHGSLRRRERKDYWIQAWAQARRIIHGPVVVPDCRFLNEAWFGREQGALLVRVTLDEVARIKRLIARDGQYEAAWSLHISEQELDTLPVQGYIPGDLLAEDIVPALEAIYVSTFETQPGKWGW